MWIDPENRAMRTFAVALALVLCPSLVHGQSASFKSLTVPCPSANRALAVSGLPKLGGSFSVSGILFPSMCTRRFCGCNIGKCNSCLGSVLVLGLQRVSIPLPGGCSLDTTPDILVFGSTTVAVPNNPNLSGFVFFMQRMDLSLQEMITPSCTKAYVPLAFSGFSDLVQGTVGT